MPATTRDERYLRYSGLADPYTLQNSAVAVVGVGAIGRQVALQLASMGVTFIDLYDFDEVEEANLGAQGYRPDQLGLPKVEATRNDMRAQNPDGDYGAIDKKIEAPLPNYDVVFCCVDCMEARRMLTTGSIVGKFIDTRMSGLNAQAYYVTNDNYPQYDETLFSNEEAHPEPCTGRSILFTSSIIAGLAIRLWTESFRSEPLYPFLRLSLADYILEPITIEKNEPPNDWTAIPSVFYPYTPHVHESVVDTVSHLVRLDSQQIDVPAALEAALATSSEDTAPETPASADEDPQPTE